MLMVVLLGLPLAVGVRAGDPKSRTNPTPQWQRLLTGADARKADELNKRIDELVNADRYAEAIRAAEEQLALRTKVQGTDHWQTVDVKWELAALKRVTALPKEKRLGWRKARQGAGEAQGLVQRAQYAKALPLKLEVLKWCREVVGEDHPHTAASYNNVAANLNAQGKYVEAGPLFQKALDILLKALGEEHPDTALGYNNVAANLDDQGKHAEATPLYQKALDIWRKVLGEEHPDTATGYNSVAFNGQMPVDAEHGKDGKASC